MAKRRENNQLNSAKLLIEIRKITSTHLPIGHSFIPYDILLHVIICHLSNKPLTIKSLFASLPYSTMGTRYHFNRLNESGWIELIADSSDSRVKLCRPTRKCQSEFQSIVKELEILV